MLRTPRLPWNTPRPSATAGGRLRSAAGCGALLAVAALVALTGTTRRPPPASQPTTAPPGPAQFQPGVWIDWHNRAVLIQSRVVLRRGPLEFLACLAGKEHESILRLEASATHIYMALGLLGLTPGHPPAWNESTCTFEPPAGDLIEIACQWEHNGRSQTVDAFEWLCETEYARTPIPRPWVFAGSLRLPDNSLAADHSGAAFALVDFPDSLIALSGGHSSSIGELWVVANTAAIPPKGTSVQLILRPAQPRTYRVTLDFRGQAFLDKRCVTLADLANLLQLARQSDPHYVQTISTVGTLPSDVRHVSQRLAALGVPPDAVNFRAVPPITTRATTGP